jgi:DNA-binding NtrC family response regulator
MCLPESFHILVTDCNRHVCNLLQRELQKEGYAVCSPTSEVKAHDYLRSSAVIDLLILDPQLFHPCGQTLFNEILGYHPEIQIILHSYKDVLSSLKTGDTIHRIEKNAESIGALKIAVRNCFRLFSETREQSKTRQETKGRST